MTRFKSIAAVVLTAAALATPGLAFAKAYVAVDSIGDHVMLGLEQLNTDQQTEIVNRGDNVNVVTKQINKGSKVFVQVVADGAEALVIGGKCQDGKVSLAVVTEDGGLVARCY